MYHSPNNISLIKSRIIRRVKHATRMGDMRNTYRILGEKPDGKILLVTYCRRREDIKVVLKDIEC